MVESSKVSEAVRGSARGSLVLMVGQAASTVVQALGVILIARFLGAVEFGVVSVAYIPVSLAMTMLDVGVSSAIIKYISQYRAEDKPSYRRVFMETGVLLNLMVSIALILAVNASSGYLADTVFGQPGVAHLIRVYSLVLLGQALLNTALSILIGYERMVSRSAVYVLYSLLRSLAGPMLVYLGLGPLGAILGNVSAALLAGLAGLAVVGAIWRLEPKGDQAFTHAGCARIMLGYGYPLFFSGLMIGLTSNINNFMLAMYVSNEMIGNYQAAARFGVLVTFFTVSVANALFPLFSKLESNPEALRMVFVNSVKYIGLIVFPIVAVIGALSHQIIYVLYSEGYRYAGVYMRIYILSYIVLGFGGTGLVSFLNAIGRSRVVFTRSLINFLLTITLGAMLIPRWGVEGLIVSLILGPLSGLAYGLHWVKANLGFTIDFRTAVKSLLAASSACVITLLFVSRAPLSPLAILLMGGVIYVTVYLLSILGLKTLNRDDYNNLITLTTGLGPFTPLVKRLLVYLRHTL